MPAFKERATGLPQLLLAASRRLSHELPEHFALRSGLFESHHHIRAGNTADIRRLARFISGRAVGLVLAGGGARGFAHIGVIKALDEAGVPFDHLGGTSMGAIIAAGIAMEWSIDELTERMREAFVTSNPLDDYTFPLIALVRGRKVSELCCKRVSATSASRKCRSRFSASPPISHRAASMSIAAARCGVRCAPAWRCLAFCRP